MTFRFAARQFRQIVGVPVVVGLSVGGPVVPDTAIAILYARSVIAIRRDLTSGRVLFLILKRAHALLRNPGHGSGVSKRRNAPSSSAGEKIAGDVEENRCGEADRIHAVHHSAVAFDHVAPVLGAEATLDCRQRQPAEHASRHDQC